VQGSVRRQGEELDFSVEDRAGGTAIPLAYTGTVPDPFREGREVIVTVEKHGERFVGERNSLITKCPSKYKTAPTSEKQNY
jgi:cytochrome c-type biogenesis protein CcmE